LLLGASIFIQKRMNLISRFNRKIKLIKARKQVEEGKNHENSWDRSTVHEYFREKIDPYAYAIPSIRNLKRTKYFSDLVNQKLQILKNDSILEVGPNSGFVLSHLFKKGYCNLTGIDINPAIIKTMKDLFPDMYKHSKIIIGTFENELPKLKDNSYSLVYSHAVLMHIHSKSNFIFEEIARIAKKYIITIEAEATISVRHFPRNYKKIFENLGFKQVFFEMTGKKISEYGNFHCRIFKLR